MPRRWTRNSTITTAGSTTGWPHSLLCATQQEAPEAHTGSRTHPTCVGVLTWCVQHQAYGAGSVYTAFKSLAPRHTSASIPPKSKTPAHALRDQAATARGKRGTCASPYSIEKILLCINSSQRAWEQIAVCVFVAAYYPLDTPVCACSPVHMPCLGRTVPHTITVGLA